MSKKKPYQVEETSLSALTRYAFNPRTHTDSQIDLIAESIKRFGWTVPILVDENNRIVAGHGRALAASRLGLEKVPCIRLSGLSEAEIRAYTIADNRLAQLSAWDDDVLSSELDAILEADPSFKTVVGFTEQEIADMIGSPAEVPEPKEEKPKKDTTICPKCLHEFVL